MDYAIIALVAVLVGAGGAVGLMALLRTFTIQAAKKQAADVLAQVDRDAENVKKQRLLEAREEALKEREQLLADVEKQRKQLRDEERTLDKREESLNQRNSGLDKREKTLETTQKKATESIEQYDRRRQALDRVLEDQRTLLQKITGMDREQAKTLLLAKVENDFQDEIGRRIMRFEQSFKQQSEQRAKEILATAIQRYASPHTSETTVSAVELPSDDMKGRIIGREGRNIRAFEKATGVEVVVDDTPGIVVVSAFDAVRREIAKLSMLKLIADGRIHPTRIEEIVAATRDEIDNHVMELGRKAAMEVGAGHLNEKLIQLLGRLKFRTSYSQNVLQHSIEVAFLCGMIADELGLDSVLARRCGLLHDIGKAADHEMEGGHPKIGADIARRCNENETVLHAIECHHEDIKVDHLYTVLVIIADAISASRPGARRETLEKYIKRLEDLEAVACEFPGVASAYAIQAGREIRVIADSEKTSDETAAKVCRDIAKAIEERLTYPGEIRVTLVREKRVVEFAR
jgi:ribonuclease Y